MRFKVYLFDVGLVGSVVSGRRGGGDGLSRLFRPYDCGYGFKVHGLGFTLSAFGFRVYGLGLMFTGLCLRV